MFINCIWRWCDGCVGGIVFAESGEEAKEKLVKKYGNELELDKVIIWHWTIDDYFDEKNPDVLDIYGG